MLSLIPKKFVNMLVKQVKDNMPRYIMSVEIE